MYCLRASTSTCNPGSTCCGNCGTQVSRNVESRSPLPMWPMAAARAPAASTSPCGDSPMAIWAAAPIARLSSSARA
eukprot:872489-Lingulodinium_polyedra.AAC.1